jgi:hypothetical protein
MFLAPWSVRPFRSLVDVRPAARIPISRISARAFLYFRSPALTFFLLVFAGFALAGFAAAGAACFAGLALLTGTIAPPGERTMAPPRVVAAGVAAFFALGFRAGFSAGAAAGLAAFLAAGFVAFFAGFSLPATGRLAPPLTPRVFSNRVTAALAAPAERGLLHMLLSLATALARDFSSLYLSFAALAGAFDILPGRVPPAPLTVGLLALVARVAVVAAVSGRLLRTVPEEANRPLASRFNCLAMPTPVMFL